AHRLAANGGVQRTAVRVQANRLLYGPGRYASLPALVLISFEEETPRSLAHLEELADRLYELKERTPRDAAERAARDAILAHQEQPAPRRRARLPPGFTGRRVVYAADFWIRRRYLRKGYLTDERRIPCVAEPGDEGAIEMLPYWDPQLKGTLPDRGERPGEGRGRRLRGSKRSRGAEAGQKLAVGLAVVGGLALLLGVALLMGLFGR